MDVKTMEKKVRKRSAQELRAGRNPSGISEMVRQKSCEVPKLMKLGKGKKNGHGNDSHRDELEAIAGRKISDEENYYR